MNHPKFALPTVTELLKHGHTERARQALVNHFVHRENPEWPLFPYRPSFMRENIYQLDRQEILHRAAQILDHRFTFLNLPSVQLEPELDWRYDQQLIRFHAGPQS